MPRLTWVVVMAPLLAAIVVYIAGDERVAMGLLAFGLVAPSSWTAGCQSGDHGAGSPVVAIVSTEGTLSFA